MQRQDYPHHPDFDQAVANLVAFPSGDIGRRAGHLDRGTIAAGANRFTAHNRNQSRKLEGISHVREESISRSTSPASSVDRVPTDHDRNRTRWLGMAVRSIEAPEASG